MGTQCDWMKCKQSENFENLKKITTTRINTHLISTFTRSLLLINWDIVDQQTLFIHSPYLYNHDEQGRFETNDEKEYGREKNKSRLAICQVSDFSLIEY